MIKRHALKVLPEFPFSIILYIQRLPQPLPNSGCYWPCRNPCLFDVELADYSDSKSVAVFNQSNQ
jgi:hypothetical protein